MARARIKSAAGSALKMLRDFWTLADYDRADQASTERIIKKQSRGSVFAQNSWAMSGKALKKQSKAADKHIKNLRKAVHKATA